MGLGLKTMDNIHHILIFAYYLRISSKSAKDAKDTETSPQKTQKTQKRVRKRRKKLSEADLE